MFVGVGVGSDAGVDTGSDGDVGTGMGAGVRTGAASLWCGQGGGRSDRR